MSKNFLGQSIKVTSEVDYLVDINYGSKDWGMVAALREVIANMLDTKAEYDYQWKKGVAYISDKGTGLPRKAFVMGASSKGDNADVIGQFGEGLKMALVTCLRNDRQVSISTVGYGAEVSKKFSEEYNTHLMHLAFTDNAQKVGTTVCMECTKEEYDEAVDLFLALKEGYNKIENNIFLPRGYICLVGLKTEENPNLLFSYDLTNKASTNRDRNAVKTKQLNEGLKQILNSIKNQGTVKLYFEGLDTMPDADEYKIVLEPKNKETWLKALTKLYGEKVAYSTTIENDIKATANGYKVIRHQSKSLAKTLANIGVISSKEASKGVKKTTALVDNNSITYPIAKNYVQEWTYLEAGREYLANALDTSANATVKHENGYCIIEDFGTGITRANFVIGNSQKADEQIGLFGEGFKLASLVMAREDRDTVITTVGYTYYPVIEENEEFGTDLFVIKYEKNNVTQGTQVKFKATLEEVEAIKGLFLNFVPLEKCVTLDKVTVIADFSNKVFVNGLMASAVESIFSYNILDKSLVNTRDRNSIDNTKFLGYVAETLNHLQDEEMIETVLTSWKSSVYSVEYQVVFTPTVLTLWEKVAKKLFDKSCIASYEPNANCIAKQVGYTLLTNIPPYIKDILTRAGVSTADDLAEKYANTGIEKGNKLVFPITSDYIDNWTIEDCLREVISNALDTNTDINLYTENGKVYVCDKGLGIPKKALLLGQSINRRSESAIGKFGEGLKIASLVAARADREFKVETVGYTFEATLNYDEEYDTPLLTYTFTDNEVTQGTTISLEGYDYELVKVKSQFLTFNNDFDEIADNMFTPGGSLFVNGVLVQTIRSAFSYNLPKTTLLNRDRNQVSQMDLNFNVARIICDVKDKEVITDIIRALYEDSWGSLIENNIDLRIPSKKKRSWLPVAKQVLEKKCLPHSSEMDLVAKDQGFVVLNSICTGFTQILNSIGFPNSKDVVHLNGFEDAVVGIVNPKDLPSEQAKRNWELTSKAIINRFGKDYETKLKIASAFTIENERTRGIYHPGSDCCYLNVKILEDTLSSILGTALHEVIHRENGHYDRTREFESDLTRLLGTLLEELLIAKGDIKVMSTKKANITA